MAPTATSTPPQDPPKAQKRRRWPWVVLAAVAAPFVATGVYYVTQLGSGGGYVDDDGEYTHVSTSSSIAHLVNHPAFAEYSDSMALFSSGFLGTITGPMAIDSISPTAQSLVDGANFAIDMTNASIDIYTALYSDSDITEDPHKADAGFFYFPSEPGAPLAVVMPGGAFMSVAINVEGLPYAAELHEAGYAVAVLQYRTGVEAGDPEDSQDVRIQRAQEDLLALMTLLADDSQYDVDLDDYSVWGSSAGGTLAVGWASDDEMGAVANGFASPTAVIGAYPYVGVADDPTAWTPATYIVAAADDPLLDIAQTDAYVEQLESIGVAHEYFRVESGGHGFGVGLGTPAEGWVSQAIAFWQSRE